MMLVRKRRGQMVGGANIAKLTETIQLTDISTNTPYDSQLNLTQFDRAVSVAQSYQLFRITKVEYRYKPIWDTYSAADISGTSLPYLYSVMNRNGSSPSYFDQNYLISQGAKARRLDDKTLLVKYKPNIVLGSSSGTITTGDLGQIKVSPWLPTQNAIAGATPAPETGGSNNTTHFGHTFYIEMDTNTKVKVAQYEVVAHFEFKKPYAPVPTNPNHDGSGGTIYVGKKV